MLRVKAAGWGGLSWGCGAGGSWGWPVSFVGCFCGLWGLFEARGRKGARRKGVFFLRGSERFSCYGLFFLVGGGSFCGSCLCEFFFDRPKVIVEQATRDLSLFGFGEEPPCFVELLGAECFAGLCEGVEGMDLSAQALMPPLPREGEGVFFLAEGGEDLLCDLKGFEGFGEVLLAVEVSSALDEESGLSLIESGGMALEFFLCIAQGVDIVTQRALLGVQAVSKESEYTERAKSE